MEANYISGFFDADGYITCVRNHAKEEPSVCIGFTNTRREILEKIQEWFLLHDIKGFISKKRKAKDYHLTGYDLKYRGSNVLHVISHIKVYHPKKLKRIEIAKKIQEITPRNGKYSKEILEQRKKLVEEFLNILW